MTRELGFDFKFTHKNSKGEVVYNSEWLPNQVSDDGFKHIFDTFFRNATAPTSFKIGLLQADAAQDDSYGDLAQVTGEGYAEGALTRNNTGFPFLALAGDNNMEIRTDNVTFENTDINTGDPAYAWDEATHAYLASVTGGSSIFIAWRALSTPRILMPGDVLSVSVRQKGLQPA